MFKIFKLLPLFFLDLDGGLPSGGDGSLETPDPQGSSLDDADNQPEENNEGSKDLADPEPFELPKYSSQMDPKKRESEDYKKYLYKHKSLNEVADDHVALLVNLDGT